MSIQRRMFPESFKREAVDRVANSGLSANVVAKTLGLHETVLRRWMTPIGMQATGTSRRSAVPGYSPSQAPSAAGVATTLRQ